jgi:hypothetical protein
MTGAQTLRRPLGCHAPVVAGSHEQLTSDMQPRRDWRWAHEMREQSTSRRRAVLSDVTCSCTSRLPALGDR